MGAADILLRTADPVVLDHLQAWGTQIATEGAAVNHIARKLNEANLRGRPMPFTDDDMTTIRTLAGGLAEFAEELRILWKTGAGREDARSRQGAGGVKCKGAEGLKQVPHLHRPLRRISCDRLADRRRDLIAHRQKRPL